MPNKYEKKNTFSREKKHANSEADIVKKDLKAQQFKEARTDERARNLRLANGLAVISPKVETRHEIIPKIVARGPPCKCGERIATVPWFSPEGEKWILCDECYSICEAM
jgi:hypothetical protein